MNQSKSGSAAVLQSGHSHNDDNAITTKLGHIKHSSTTISDIRSDNSSEERILLIRSGSRGDCIIQMTEVQITTSSTANDSDNNKTWSGNTSHVAWGTKHDVEDRV